MAVRVNQINGRLNLNIKPPNMSLQTNHAADFSMTKQEGTLKVNTKDAKVEISTRKARAALNHKFYKIYSKDLAQKGMQDSMQGIAKYARQGNQLAEIEKGGKPLASQAKQNSKDAEKEVVLRSKPGAEIKASAGDIKVDYKPDRMQISVQANWAQRDLE